MCRSRRLRACSPYVRPGASVSPRPAAAAAAVALDADDEGLGAAPARGGEVGGAAQGRAKDKSCIEGNGHSRGRAGRRTSHAARCVRAPGGSAPQHEGSDYPSQPSAHRHVAGPGSTEHTVKLCVRHQSSSINAATSPSRGPRFNVRDACEVHTALALPNAHALGLRCAALGVLGFSNALLKQS